MIERLAKYYYEIKCDKCGAIKYIEETDTAYNAPQAARSAGWSFGRNKIALCPNCRKPYKKIG